MNGTAARKQKEDDGMRTNQCMRRIAFLSALTAGIAFVPAPSSAQGTSLHFVSPAEGTVVRPGQTITILVTADYSLEKVVLLGQRPLGVGQVVSGGAPGIVARGRGDLQPLQFVIQIPAQIQPGMYRITAIGRNSDGDTESEALSLDVEKSQEPLRIWAEPALIQFTRTGERIPVRVLGAFADASKEELTKSRKTTFSSADPHVATVDSSGMVTAVGPGKTMIQVSTASSDYSIPVRVE